MYKSYVKQLWIVGTLVCGAMTLLTFVVGFILEKFAEWVSWLPSTFSKLADRCECYRSGNKWDEKQNNIEVADTRDKIAMQMAAIRRGGK